MDDQQTTHLRYYQSGGITIRVEADLPFAEDTFAPKFEEFAVNGPGEDMVSICHHFSLEGLRLDDLGREVYRKAPWAIYDRGDSWVYLGIHPRAGDEYPHQVAVLSRDHTQAHIYHPDTQAFQRGRISALTMFPTDQILLARVLADRQGCYVHSAGAILDGRGLLFVGHSEAGKSTLSRMLQAHRNEGDMKVDVLCDDRNIVRRLPEGFWVYGTWSHGEWPVVSGKSASLRAILFLEQATENRLVPLEDRREIVRRLLACLIRPLVTADWWIKTLGLVEQMAREMECYVLRFDRSGAVVQVLCKLCREPIPTDGSKWSTD